MLSKREYEYYNRHLLLEEVGENGQNALKNSSVLVIGAGGLGCPLLLYLTGAGVGHIGIVDGDKVNISNLHRQTLYSRQNVGCSKTKTAIEQLKDRNAFVKLSGYEAHLTAKNALDIIKDYDIVVDATDNFPVRYLINDACIILDKPWVFASIERFQGQLSVFNYKKGPSYRCLFPQPPKPESAPGCSEIGVLGVLTGILGGLQANEVIKMIINRGTILSGKILMIDALRNAFYTVDIERNEQSKDQVLDLKSGVDDSVYFHFCMFSEAGATDISVNEVMWKLKAGEKFQFIDIRPAHSEDVITDALRIPLSKVDLQTRAIEKNMPLVIFCERGIDSQKAAKKFKNRGFKKVYSLQGGLQAWRTFHKGK